MDGILKGVRRGNGFFSVILAQRARKLPRNGDQTRLGTWLVHQLGAKKKIICDPVTFVPPIFYTLLDYFERRFVENIGMMGVFYSLPRINNPNEYGEENCWETSCAKYLINELNDAMMLARESKSSLPK